MKHFLNKFFKLNSISKKIIFIIFIISSLFTFAATFYEIFIDYKSEVKFLKKNLENIYQTSEVAITNGLWNLNLQQVQDMANSIRKFPGVKLVKITSSDRTDLAILSGSQGSEDLVQNFNLYYLTGTAKVHIGNLEIHGDFSVIKQRVKSKVILFFLVQAVRSLIVSFFIFLAINKVLTSHLLNISQQLERPSSMYDGSKVILDRDFFLFDWLGSEKDELDKLVESLNFLKKKNADSIMEVQKLNLSLEDKIKENTLTILKQREKIEFTKRMSSLGEMVGGIAHEINSPLAILKMNTNKLSREVDGLPSEGRHGFSKIILTFNKTIDRVASIIKILRKHYRNESTVEARPIRIKEILDEVLELSKEKLSSLGVKIDVRCDNPEIIATCNELEISQVLLNLINNSCDAIENYDQKWIKFIIEEVDNSPQIRIVDCGGGIPEDIQSKIFQPFFTTKEVDRGTGIGLSISYNLVNTNKGQLLYENFDGHTSFLVKLIKAA